MENNSIIEGSILDRCTILLVEDNQDDAFLTQSAFTRAGVTNPIQVVSDGQEAIEYLCGMGRYHDREQFPLPFTVFLDLNVPRKNGLEILAWIRQQPGLKRLTVHVLTASSRSMDVVASADLNANSYLIKPSKLDALVEMLASWKSLNQFTAFPSPANTKT